MDEKLKLPEHFELERELREQLSDRAGQQRCVVGRDELLLVLHEVPKAGVAEREAKFFWRRMDGRWIQPGGPGLDEVGALLERYANSVNLNLGILEKVNSAKEIFDVAKQAMPLSKSLRAIVVALEQALVQEAEDRVVRTYRDRAQELERAADLLQSCVQDMIVFRQLETAGRQAEATDRLVRVVSKLGLIAGFFLPLIAFGGLTEINMGVPGVVSAIFWWLYFGGFVAGGWLLWRSMKGRE